MMLLGPFWRGFSQLVLGSLCAVRPTLKRRKPLSGDQRVLKRTLWDRQIKRQLLNFFWSRLLLLGAVSIPPVCPQKVPSGCVTKYRICGQRYSKNGRNSPPAPLQLFSNSIRLQTHFLTRIRWSTTSPASRYVRSETATPTNQTASKTLSSDSKTTLKRPHNSSWPLRCPQIDP